MDCIQAQETIVRSFIETLAHDNVFALAAHCAECPACAAFAARQQALDERLVQALVPGDLSQDFRRLVLERATTTPLNWWRDALPEIVHFLSWGSATAAGALLLPISASLTVGTGVALAIGSYFALAIVRTSLEASA